MCHTASHLDEHGRQPLGAQLLVHAQEVDFHHVDGGAVHAHPRWNGTDEAHQPAGMKGEGRILDGMQVASSMHVCAKRTRLRPISLHACMQASRDEDNASAVLLPKRLFPRLISGGVNANQCTGTTSAV